MTGGTGLGQREIEKWDGPAQGKKRKEKKKRENRAAEDRSGPGPLIRGREGKKKIREGWRLGSGFGLRI